MNLKGWVIGLLPMERVAGFIIMCPGTFWIATNYSFWALIKPSGGEKVEVHFLFRLTKIWLWGEWGL